MITHLGIFFDADAALHHRSSGRTGRHTLKLRDATEDTPRASVFAGASPLFVDVTPVLESEPLVRDNPSPCKQCHRGAGNKHRRRDVDDGNATYPAKRIWSPRPSASLLLLLLMVPTLRRPRKSILLPLRRVEGMKNAGPLDGDRRGRVDNLQGGLNSK